MTLAGKKPAQFGIFIHAFGCMYSHTRTLLITRMPLYYPQFFVPIHLFTWTLSGGHQTVTLAVTDLNCDRHSRTFGIRYPHVFCHLHACRYQVAVELYRISHITNLHVMNLYHNVIHIHVHIARNMDQ